MPDEPRIPVDPPRPLDHPLVRRNPRFFVLVGVFLTFAVGMDAWLFAIAGARAFLAPHVYLAGLLVYVLTRILVNETRTRRVWRDGSYTTATVRMSEGSGANVPSRGSLLTRFDVLGQEIWIWDTVRGLEPGTKLDALVKGRFVVVLIRTTESEYLRIRKLPLVKSAAIPEARVASRDS